MITREELEDILEGEVSRAHPSYEFRPGQIRMAQAVARAVEEGQHLCVEAGTGTGKTLAYLLPAIFSSKRVVVSTGTKNLQDQVFFKDLPFLEKALGRRISACYVKGRSNYLCLKKLGEIDSGRMLFPPGDWTHLKEIRDWSRSTGTGDIAELKALPEDLPIWRQLDARRDSCTGQKCPDFDECFVTRVRRRALESDLVVVNHHLFFADLALRQGDFAAVLPDYAVVIFDEAHDLEDVATQYFGATVSNYRLEEIVRDTDKALGGAGEKPEVLPHLPRLRLSIDEFFGSFREREGRFIMEEAGGGLGIRRGPAGSNDAASSYRRLLMQLTVLGSGLSSLGVRSDVIDALIRRTSELQDGLRAIMESDSTEQVYWYEVRGRGTFLWASPINVSAILAERLFGKVDCAILTSATLSTGGNFRFIRSRLGLERADELVLESHFDFMRQALLYIPNRLPEPREAGWVDAACEHLVQILQASRGRAFILFTSYAQMEQVYSALAGRLPFPLLIQGEMSRSGLLDRFRETPQAVLFATSSFWQGVDVQGDQLSCVVIDKLPFSVPSEPIVAARIRSLNESGGN
ncbi:MAG: ATP-dependent DNA helicase, partial [Acidobacteria bacterium]|nr:ATP-dependent DNA helicase [Acidobacteriota bacterium]